MRSDADVVHLQWLSVPDARPLPAAQPPARVHGALPAAGRRPRAPAPARAAAIAWTRSSPTPSTARPSCASWSAIRAACTVIPHGAFDHLTRQPDERPLPDELAAVEGPVVLCFGLVRPYKGVDVLLEAFAEIEGAELWVVGMPRMDLAPLRGARRALPRRRVRFVDRFVTDPEIPALLSPRRHRRACRTARSSSRASSTRRSRSASRWSPARRRLPRGRRARRRAARWSRRATPRPSPRRSQQLLGDPAARERARRGRRRARRPDRTRGTRSPARTLDLYRDLLSG